MGESLNGIQTYQKRKPRWIGKNYVCNHFKIDSLRNNQKKYFMLFFVEWSRLFCNQLKIYEKTRLEKIKTVYKNIASFSLYGCCNVNF